MNQAAVAAANDSTVGVSMEERAKRFDAISELWIRRQSRQKYKQDRMKAWTEDIKGCDERIRSTIEDKVPEEIEGQAQRYLAIQQLFQEREELVAGRKAEKHELLSEIEEIDAEIDELINGGEQLGLFSEDEQEDAARQKVEAIAGAEFAISEHVEITPDEGVNWYRGQISDVILRKMADGDDRHLYTVTLLEDVAASLNVEEYFEVTPAELRRWEDPAAKKGGKKKSGKKKTSKKKTSKTETKTTKKKKTSKKKTKE